MSKIRKLIARLVPARQALAPSALGFELHAFESNGIPIDVSLWRSADFEQAPESAIGGGETERYIELGGLVVCLRPTPTAERIEALAREEGIASAEARQALAQVAFSGATETVA